MPKLEQTQQSSSRAGGRRARAARVSSSLSEINVVPLVDVMLVLLVIFMVAAPMMQQGFPVSLEFQFLADEGKGKRPTGNVCTPGTNLEIDGKLVTQHIVQSTAPTFPAEEWVKIEIEVRGNAEVIHRVNGKEVLRYQKPQLDPKGDVISADALLNAGAPMQLEFGYIALQAEGQPVWFRNIELKALGD